MTTHRIDLECPTVITMMPIDYGSITHRAALRAIQLGCTGSLSAGPGWGPQDDVHEDAAALLSEAQLPHLRVDPSEAIRAKALKRDPSDAEQLRALAVHYTDVEALRGRLSGDHPLDRDPVWRHRLRALLAACER